MQEGKASYSLAAVISIVLHAGLLAILGLSVTSTPLKPTPQPQHKAIEAVVVNSKAVQQQVERIKKVQQDKLAKERQRQREAEARIKKLNQERKQKERDIAKAKAAQKKAEQAAKRAESKRIAKEKERVKAEAAAAKAEQQRKKNVAQRKKAEAAAKKAEQQRKKKLAEAKKAEQQRAQKVAERKKAEAAAAAAEKKRKVAEQKRKAAEQKERERLAEIARKKKAEQARKREQAKQEKLLQQQIEAEFGSELDSEIQQLDAVRNQEIISEVDEYKLRISSTIQKYILTDDTMKGKSCALDMRLADSGLVLSVSSGTGDKLVCRAAVNAVNKVGSLPMSKDPEVAAQLKNIKLIFEPEI